MTRTSPSMPPGASPGHSAWTAVSAKTKANPLEFAIPGIEGATSVENQGSSLAKLFDFKEKDAWHTKHGEKAVPLSLIHI